MGPRKKFPTCIIRFASWLLLVAGFLLPQAAFAQPSCGGNNQGPTNTSEEGVEVGFSFTATSGCLGVLDEVEIRDGMGIGNIDAELRLYEGLIGQGAVLIYSQIFSLTPGDNMISIVPSGPDPAPCLVQGQIYTFTIMSLDPDEPTVEIQGYNMDNYPGGSLYNSDAGGYIPTKDAFFTFTGTDDAEIDVQGNGISIQDGDITPDPADNTDFGLVPVGATVTHSFDILNTGTEDLFLTGTPIVEILGDPEFTVTSQPANITLVPGATETFTIEFAPTAANITYNATVSIANTDCNEEIYTFAITGAGDVCEDAEIPTVMASPSDPVCPNATVTLTASGNLNDAADWFWYTDGCGQTPIGQGASIDVMPATTTTYFVRGEGGCVTMPGDCATITVTVEDNEDPTIECPDPITVDADANCEAIVPDFTLLTGAELANSVSDFSGVQGDGNWFYGFVTPSMMPTFTELDPNDFDMITMTWLGTEAGGTPSLNASGGTPGFDSGNWSVRRWESEYTGMINISGEFVDLDPNCGDGAMVSIWVNGFPEFSMQVPDMVPMPYGIPLFVEEGDMIDFAIEPLLDNECDETLFTAQISVISNLLVDDNCGVVSITQDPVPGTIVNAGTTEVEVTATDELGNTASCIVEFIVNDVTPPTALCQAITVQLDLTGNVMIAAGDVDGGSSDACGPVDLAIDISSFGCSEVGDNDVVLTVTDEAGLTDECTAVVTVGDDNVQPEALCMSATVQLDVNGMISITPTVVDAGSNGVCGIMDLSVVPSLFTCAEVGPNTVTLTVTDVNMNTDQCTATVTVEDVTNPVANCMNATVQLDASGDGSLLPEDVDNGSSDACGIGSLMLDISSFDCSNVGSNNTVTLTVTDENGNMASCQSTITVEDNVDPVAVCQAVTVELDDNGDAIVTPAEIDNGSSDACGIASLALDITSFDCSNVGDVTVTLTVTDNNGNTSTCMDVVTVEDNLPPTATCSDFTVELDASGMATISGSDIDGGSTDNCGVDMLTADPNTFGCDNLGNNPVTLTVTDVNGNSSTCMANVLVEDNTAPEVICEDFVAQLDANGEVTIDPVDLVGSSTDACGNLIITADPDMFTCADIGENTVTVTVSDASGNMSSCESTVTVEDNVAPMAVCMDITVQLDASGVASIVAADVDGGSTDNCGVANTSIDINSFGCGDVGTVTVTLTVTDVNGNSSDCPAMVTVEDNVDPNAQCQSITVQLDNMGDASITPADIDFGSSDACGIADLSLDITDFTCDDIGNSPITVTLTVMDNNGNTATCTGEVTVEDNLAPEALCQDIEVFLGADGTVLIADEDLNNGSGDNCEIEEVKATQVLFTCDDLGDNIVMLNVTDESHNTASCTSTVTVIDDIVPTAECQDIQIQIGLAGFFNITPAMVDNGSSDNCDIDLSVDPFTFTCDDIGFQTATLTVSDEAGNSATCTSTVTVLAGEGCEEPDITNFGVTTYFDPCDCLGGGLFGEEIVIGPTLPGMVWTVASNAGLLDPDNALIPFPVGTPFVEVPAPMGQSYYVLVGNHLDAVGYALEAESPFYPDVTLALANTCYYVQPEILGLNDQYCVNSNPIPLVGDPGAADIVDEFFTIDGNPATEFDPFALGLGTHTVSYTVNAGTAGSNDPSDPGCTVTVTQDVEVVNSFPGSIACNNLIIIGVDQLCQANITPDMVLEGDYYCYDEFIVEIFFNGNSVPNPVPQQFFGIFLDYTVTNINTGNFCMGQIFLEDNLPPVIDCSGEAIEVSCLDDLDDIPPPTVDDNCIFTNTQLIDEVFLNEDPCDDGTVILQRTYVAFDGSGNESDPCVQTIEIFRVDNDQIDFPNDIVWSCSQYNDFPNITDPEALHPVVEQFEVGILETNATGITSTNVLENTGSGNPGEINSAYCGYAYTYSDDTLAACGNSFTIKRTWTVIDECGPGVITGNAAGEDNIQLISVADVTPPEISVDPFTLSANLSGPNNSCKSIGFIPPPVVTDDCNEWTVEIFTPIGEADYINFVDGSQGGTVPLPGLPLGTHTITYKAIDACGNWATLEVEVEVIDDTAPTAVCDEITDVNITSGGEAVVNAITFDDGSLDNCCIGSFEVKRVGDDCEGNPDDFGPTVTFCCEDISNSPIFVILKVNDCNGNSNTCEVQVLVNDKSDPILLFCPQDQEISCEDYNENYAAALAQDDFGVLDIFGQPIFQDNCGQDELTIDHNVIVNIDMCSEGTITRNWIATDPSGNGPLICQQMIQVFHVSDWVVEFPANITAQCVDGTLPDLGEPEIFYDDCELIAVSFEDTQFDVVPDACFKIERTWTVINWCVYDDYGYDAFLEADYAECDQNVDWDNDGDQDCRTFREGVNTEETPDGFITYKQIIKVIDEEAPIVTIPVIDGCIVDTDCNTDVTLPFPAAMDDCSDIVTVDILGDFGTFTDITGDVVVEDVEIGSYTIVYRVTDNCGNTAFEEVSFDVEDCTNPAVACITLITEIMQTQMLEVPAYLFDAGSTDNCSDELFFSFSGDITDTLLLVTCDDANDTLDLEIWVTDEVGNQDFCEVTLEVQDNLNVCGNNNQIVTVAGLVVTEEEDPVEGALVEVNGNMFNTPTSTDGWYEMEVDDGGDYTLIPGLDEDHGNGITTYDMVLITRHVLGSDLLDSPYKIIAADANRSGSVSTLDLVEIRKIILLINDAFPNNTSWRFVDKDHNFANPTNPWAGNGFPEFINYNNLTVDELEADFVGVKVGDVNGSAQANSLGGAEERTFAGAIRLQMQDQELEAGEVYTVYLSAEDWMVSGYQFSLQFDPEVMQFLNLEEEHMQGEHFGLSYLEEGVLTGSWHQEKARRFQEGERLFGLTFRALEDSRLSELLYISSRYTAAEAYGSDDELLEVQLSFQTDLSDGFALYQNRPNPFEEATAISFSLPATARAQLTIFDASGRVLKTIDATFQAGYNELKLDGLRASGVLYYRLDTPTHSATKKMIRLD